MISTPTLNVSSYCVNRTFSYLKELAKAGVNVPAKSEGAKRQPTVKAVSVSPTKEKEGSNEGNSHQILKPPSATSSSKASYLMSYHQLVYSAVRRYVMRALSSCQLRVYTATFPQGL